MFDRSAFERGLTTLRFGRHAILRAETQSTNDDAWDAWANGAGDGTVVIADHQTRGRGRNGRTWHSAPGLGLALSLVIVPDAAVDPPGTLPLIAGLALTEALERLGVAAELKWPNDVLIGGAKVAGILCEGRHSARGSAAVVGLGVNVAHSAANFPPGLRASATSLALAGHAHPREAVAAAFLNALEARWDERSAHGDSPGIDAWRSRARMWGTRVAVHGPAGTVRGIARTLDPDGALVIETAPGVTTRATVGDLTIDGTPGETRSGTP